jgi:hypothetical protein
MQNKMTGGLSRPFEPDAVQKFFETGYQHSFIQDRLLNHACQFLQQKGDRLKSGRPPGFSAEFDHP